MNQTIKHGTEDNIVTYEHYCDTIADLANIPADQINLGSTAIVLKNANDELEVYIATSDKEWVPLLSGGGGSYSSVAVEPLEITLNGDYVAPAGTAYTPVSVNVPNGFAQEITSLDNGGDYYNFTGMEVEGIYSISSNGLYDVSAYASAEVNVAGSGSTTEITSLYVTLNGTYNAPTNMAYSPVVVDVMGGDSTRIKEVNFIDYDGSIVASYTSAEFFELSALPTNPTHTGLVSQGWNWTMAEITSQLTEVGGVVWVGQLYATESGGTEVDIEISSEAKSIVLNLYLNCEATIDWGDGTSDTDSGSGYDFVIQFSHTYAEAGQYTITITSDNLDAAIPEYRFIYSGIENTMSVSNISAATCIKAIRLSQGMDINFSGLLKNTNLETITMCNDTEFTSYRANFMPTNIFEYCYALRSITIPPTIIEIGEYTFNRCYSLQNISLPYNLTKLGDYAFSDCISLKGVTIPNEITAIPTSLLDGCVEIEEINLPSSITSIGTQAFYNTSIDYIYMPDSIEYLGNSIFRGCKMLQQVANLTGTNINTIPSATFRQCYTLENINLPAVTSIEQNAFYDCDSLQYISLSSTTTTIGNSAFNGCNSLYNIEMPNVTTIGNKAFYNCMNLRNIQLPNTLTTIGSEAFYGCAGMLEVTIPASVTSIGDKAFFGVFGTIHMSSSTPPTLGGSNVFSTTLPLTIAVPQGSLETYQTAEYWSAYASYMIEEGN